MLYAGVDTHKHYSRVVVTDNLGNEVAQASLQNDKASFQDFFLQFNEPTRAVLEAGRTWGIIYDLLEDIGIEPVLANPVKTRAMVRQAMSLIWPLAARQLHRRHNSLESWVRFWHGLASISRRTNSMSSFVISRP